MKTQKSAKEKADLLKKNQTDYKKIGKRIKALRIEAGYSALEDFAHEHEIPRAQYGRYEQGVNMKFSSLLPILRVHKLSMQEFFAGIE